MRGRVALSDPDIVKRIRRDFVPCVGEHSILLRGPLRDWWERTVREANPRYAGASTQGYYVVGADGRGYAWDNFPPRLAQFLERGTELHRRNPAGRAGVTDELIRAAAPRRPPEGASVVRLFTRITPLPDDAGPMNALLGRDYMWVLADEVKEMIAASERRSEFALPRTLVARLTLFHLVDNVRGQVWPYRPDSVRSATLTARVVGTAGGKRTMRLGGEYAKQDAHPPQWSDRGQRGKIEGELEIDLATAKIVKLRAIVESEAWSDASYDRASRPPSGRYPLVTALVEANDELAREVTPEQAGTGNYYLRPELPRR